MTAAPALLVVAHGSRDPRAAATLTGLAQRVTRLLPRTTVRLCFLEHSLPSLEQALAATATTPVVVVPLLLSQGYHADQDLPGRVRASARGPVVVTPAVGPDPGLDELVHLRARRLGGSGGLDGLGGSGGIDAVVLAGPGSRDAERNAVVAATAARAGRRLGLPIAAGFVTAAPGIGFAVAGLREHGRTRVGVVPWFLAPGLLFDRALSQARRAGTIAAAPPLADSAQVARIVQARYASAVVPAGADGRLVAGGAS